VRAGKRAVIRVDERARGTPRSRFTVALEAAVIRYVELADLAGVACAAARAYDGTIEWAPESRPVPGKIVRWQKLPAGSHAARVSSRGHGGGRGADDDSPREVIGAAWGGAAPFVEQTIRMGEGSVLSWIVPAR
jgi:hypothetical protein